LQFRFPEECADPRTTWWQLGRGGLGAGSTGYLVGRLSGRVSTAEKTVVAPTEQSCLVGEAIERRCKHAVAEAPVENREQIGR
jgi:hypothetical protein